MMKKIIILGIFLMMITITAMSATALDSTQIDSLFSSNTETKNILFEQTVGTKLIDTSKITTRAIDINDIDQIVAIYNKGRDQNVWCTIKYDTSTWTLLHEVYDLINSYGRDNIIIYVSEYDGKVIGFALSYVENNVLNNKALMFDTDIDTSQWEDVAQITLEPNLVESTSRGVDNVKTYLSKGIWMEDFITKVYGCQNKQSTEWNCTISHYREVQNNKANENMNIIYTLDASKSGSIIALEGEELIMNNVVKEPILSKENIIKQTENSITYSKPNGKMNTIIYSNPISYKENNQWILYDDNTTYLETKNNITSNKIMNVTFDNNNILETNKDNFTFKILSQEMYYNYTGNVINLSNNKNNISNDKEYILYKDYFKGSDLIYKSEPNTIKEAVVFNSKPNISNANENGTIDVITYIYSNYVPFKANGAIFFKSDGFEAMLNQPYVKDMEGRILYLDYILNNKGNNTYQLTVKIPYGWMNSSEKVYPIILDPTVTMGIGNLNVRLCNGDASICGSTRGAFMRYNISNIPTGVNITNVTYYFTPDSSGTIFNNSLFNVDRFNSQTWSASDPYTTFTNLSKWDDIATQYYNKTDTNVTNTVNILGNGNNSLLDDYNHGNTYFTLIMTSTKNVTSVNNVTTNMYSDPWSICWFSESKTANIMYNFNTINGPYINVTYTTNPPAVKASTVKFSLLSKLRFSIGKKLTLWK